MPGERDNRRIYPERSKFLLSYILCAEEIVFWRFFPVLSSDHRSLATTFSEPIAELGRHGVTLIAFVTDNARNLTMAKTRNELSGPVLRHAGNHTSVQQLTGGK